MKEALCFDDVLLVPQKSEIITRSDVDISAKFYPSDIVLDSPIISSPMDTVTGVDMAISMYEAGGLGIIHRYNSTEEQVDMVRAIRKMVDKEFGAAIGVTGDYLERAQALYDEGCKLFCLDVAHGHHALMRYALQTLRNTLGWDVHLMGGSVATLEGFNDLADWGADSIRVGIGGGSICSTRLVTGHGVPTFQSVIDCSRSDRDATLIADGGIRTSGDMVKALAAGADFVMAGSLLAGVDESPGEVIFMNGEKRKVYRGMASKDAQIDWRGHASTVEGVSSSVQYKGSLTDVMNNLARGIKSGLSYSGSKSIKELHSKAIFIRQTGAGLAESHTHINRR